MPGLTHDLSVAGAIGRDLGYETGAQKARWAKVRKAAKKEAPNDAAAPAVKSATPNGVAPKTAPVKKAVSAKKAAQPKTKTPLTPAP